MNALVIEPTYGKSHSLTLPLVSLVQKPPLVSSVQKPSTFIQGIFRPHGPNFQHRSQSFLNYPSYQPIHQFGYSSVTSLGKGEGRFSNKGKVVYQLCSKIGHIVMQCYYKYNTNYNNPSIIPHFYTGSPHNTPYQSISSDMELS